MPGRESTVLPTGTGRGKGLRNPGGPEGLVQCCMGSAVLSGASTRGLLLRSLAMAYSS
jgi:hypothetical protein